MYIHLLLHALYDNYQVIYTVSTNIVGLSDKSSKNWISQVKIGTGRVQILPCSHKIHNQCVEKMILEKCPVKNLGFSQRLSLCMFYITESKIVTMFSTGGHQTLLVT